MINIEDDEVVKEISKRSKPVYQVGSSENKYDWCDITMLALLGSCFTLVVVGSLFKIWSTI